MSERKGLIVLAATVFGLTLLDIAVVETFYRPAADWANIWRYHMIYWALITVLPLLGSYFTKSLLPLLTYVLFFFGVEDTLFYGLQGYLPETYWGVTIAGIFNEPALQTVLWLNIIGLVLSVVFAKSFYKRVDACGFQAFRFRVIKQRLLEN